MPSLTSIGICVPVSSRYSAVDAVDRFSHHRSPGRAATDSAGRPGAPTHYAARGGGASLGRRRRHDSRDGNQGVGAIGDAANHERTLRIGSSLVRQPHHRHRWSGSVPGRQPDHGVGDRLSGFIHHGHRTRGRLQRRSSAPRRHRRSGRRRRRSAAPRRSRSCLERMSAPSSSRRSMR